MRLFREKNRQIEISAMTYSTLAQSVERATVNRLVPRSSRGGGATHAVIVFQFLLGVSIPPSGVPFEPSGRGKRMKL